MSVTRTDTPVKLRKSVEKALKRWQDPNAAIGLSSLALFRKLQQSGITDHRQIANELLLAGLNALEAKKPRLAQILRLRFLNDVTAYQTAHQLGLEESTIYSLQREGFALLTELIYGDELATRVQDEQRYLQHLELPTYTALIGVEQHLAELRQVLMQDGPPWVVAIEGIGGIGKTSLANGLVRQLLIEASLDAVGWVTARPHDFDLGGALVSRQQPVLSTEGLIHALIEQLATDDVLLTSLSMGSMDKQLVWLQSELRAKPHLLVIDNLETVVDVEALMPLLSQLSDPSRFLLTSREHVKSHTGIYHFVVPELNETDALHLIREEARVGNLPHVATADDDLLRPIFETVGGNPLALRLVVGQTHSDSLDLILEDLVQARGKKAEQLYSYIYRRAWEKLDENARYVWLALPLLTTAHATAANLAEICGKPQETVRAALDQLVRLNLVNCQGGLNSRGYSLHNLTRTFLQEQVGQWQ